MSILENIGDRVRKALIVGGAGLVLSTGLGLGTAGVAHAEPNNAICFTSDGIAKISAGGKTSSQPVHTVNVCVGGVPRDVYSGGAQLQVAKGDAAVSSVDTIVTRRADGSFRVELQGETLRGETLGGSLTPTATTKVGFDLAAHKGGTFTLRDVTRDSAGRTADATVTYRITSFG